MVEPHGFDRYVVEWHTSLLDVKKVAFCLHLAHVHRKVRSGHLLFHHPLQGADAARGMKHETVLGFVVERPEKRQTLNVIPMEEGDKDVSGDGLAIEFPEQVMPQRAEAGATVEDENAVAQTHLDAGGIASVAQVFRLGS